MSNTYVLNAEARDDAGKGASRRLRHQARVPAIVYGNNVAPANISLELRELIKQLEDDVFYASVIDLNIGGKKEQVILRDLQRHPAKGTPMHADFQRVDAKQKINLHIPLHFLNEDKCVGVKQEGGEIQHNLAEVEVLALPKDLPDFIEVDMADVKLNQIVHLSDLKLPKGVELVQLVHGHDLPVAAVHAKKGAAAEEEAPAAE